jgi:transglutaminase-like putative cysteine protease
MKGVLFVLLLFHFSSGYGFKKEVFYPASDIPPQMIENANSVVRNREALLEIQSKTKIRYTIKEIVTVLNSNGDKEGVLYMPYNANSKPTVITANFYDATGNIIKKVKDSEIYDQCYFDGFSLYSDARFKTITPQISIYPYTVEYECTYDFNGMVDYPDWMPCDAYFKSVQYSSYTIKIYDDSEIRIKESKIEASKKAESGEDCTVYFWEIENSEAMEYEPFSPALYELIPYVEVSPITFSYYEKEGNMSTWDDFGDWINMLLIDKDILPEERITQLKELTAGMSDPFEKVKTVYAFLQEKTRYVSIQLGIGGFQPFAAATVDEVGYGDCKALANYTKAMLTSVGIESYYTLVKAGRDAEEVDPDFPSQSFNHVIVAVPLANDTIFLECTSQFAPCGYLSDFTSDRYALLISENGSKLVRTKSYDEKVNTWQSNTTVNINESGSASIFDTVCFRGTQYDMVEDELRKTKDKQIEAEFKSNKIPGARILDISYLAQKEKIPNATRMRNIEVDKFATKMGDRFFFPLNVLNKRTAIPRKCKDRKYPFEIDKPYSDFDRIVYILPEGYGVEYLPAPKDLVNEFGEFSYQIRQDGNKLIYERKDVHLSGKFPAEKYMDFVNFSKEIVGADGQKVILKKL